MNGNKKQKESTLKNKLYALMLFGVGVTSAIVLDGNLTFCVLTSFFAIALFLAKKNWIY